MRVIDLDALHNMIQQVALFPCYAANGRAAWKVF
jgi:hypothetical protein